MMVRISNSKEFELALEDERMLAFLASMGFLAKNVQDMRALSSMMLDDARCWMMLVDVVVIKLSLTQIQSFSVSQKWPEPQCPGTKKLNQDLH